jgi:RAB protein geranylgeranyltransferase component A
MVLKNQEIKNREKYKGKIPCQFRRELKAEDDPEGFCRCSCTMGGIVGSISICYHCETRKEKQILCKHFRVLEKEKDEEVVGEHYYLLTGYCKLDESYIGSREICKRCRQNTGIRRGIEKWM